MTVKVWPPIVSVPVRPAPLFALTENDIVLLPAPAAAEVIAIQFTFDAAVHAQPVLVAKATEPGPPAAPIDA